ncbi:MAG TPA: MFS transporter [Streptosporangiaceae bacterium]|nr:MFS transporter [Streptosporangiaceae bacterium]
MKSPIAGFERIVTIALVDSIGTGLYLAGGALFFTRAIGIPATEVGLGLSVAAICGMLTAYPLGRVADRGNPRQVVAALMLWRAVGMAAYALVHNFLGFLVIVCLLGMAERADSPIMQAVIAAAAGEKRRVRAMAVTNASRNVGFTLGVLLASPILATGTRGSFLWIMFGDAVTFVGAAFLVLRLPLVDKPLVNAAPRMWASLRRIASDRAFLTLTGLNGVLAIHMTVLSIGLPLWVTFHTHAPPVVVAPLLAVNTVLTVALQVRLSKGSDSPSGAARAARNAGLALCCSALLMAFSAKPGAIVAVIVLVVAVTAHTLGELWQSAGGWGLSYALAPAESRASYLAFFSLGVTAQGIVGPAVVTAGVIAVGTTGWVVLAVVLLLTGLTLPMVRPWGQRAAGRAPRDRDHRGHHGEHRRMPGRRKAPRAGGSHRAGVPPPRAGRRALASALRSDASP